MRKETRTKSGRSYFGPVLLIVVGLVFLADTLGFISANGWGTIWKLWPVLLIVAGIDDLIRGEGIAWPIVLIGAGSFLLYAYFGSQDWISWTKLVQLWPIILIAAGIDLMFKGQSGWNILVGIILALVLIGGAVWIFFSEYQASADYSDIRETFSKEIVSSEVDISLGWGEIVLSNSTEENVLIQGRISPPDNSGGDQELTDSRIIYHLENDQLTVFPLTSRWELDLTDRLDLDLSVHNGAGEALLALEQLELESLQVNQGVGRLSVRLPRQSERMILIKQAVGTVQVVIPEDIRVVVDAQNGLTIVDYPDDFELGNGFYGSPGATPSNADLDITVEQAIGIVSLEYAR